MGDIKLRWEQHNEFSTYTWELGGANALKLPPDLALSAALNGLAPKGKLLLSVDLQAVRTSEPVPFEEGFYPASLCAGYVNSRKAVIAGDFVADGDGFVRMLIFDLGLAPYKLGALAQRLLELETYRTMALLGLPEAQRIAPVLQQLELELSSISLETRQSNGLESNKALLDHITSIAVVLEAEAATCNFRFAASHAYHQIVQSRLAVIDETALDGVSTFASFLGRRLDPAMRTCTTTARRQVELSTQLSRAAQLLRTRVDIEMQEQNRDLLTALNERTRAQLHLQQTVERLSIAAVGYYLIGLSSYVFQGLESIGVPLNHDVANAVMVPIVIAALVYHLIGRSTGPR